MLASQQFCVKWNSYSSNLQNVFPRLLTSEHFVDITLACEGQMIKCHKVVLSACSTYFEKLLVHNPCQHPIIFMKDMKHWEIQALVDFMYKGEVNVSQDELNSLLVAAEALQIRGLCGSDSVNRSTQDVNRHGQSNTSSAGSRVPSVSLPHDTVLSGGTAVGRESPPFKRRRPPNEEKEHSQIHHTSMPRIANITSTTSNSRGEVNSLPAPQASAVDHTKTDGFADEIEDELPDKKPIKQELDMDDTFLEGDLDADGPDEDYGSLEHQEDSDSNNREEVPPHSPLDQPGPSGLAPPCSTPLDKAATGRGMLLHLGNTGLVPGPLKGRAVRSYSSSNLWQALLDVKQGESIYRAAKHNGIPRKTLRNWMQRWNIKSVYPMPKQLQGCPTNQKGFKRTPL